MEGAILVLVGNFGVISFPCNVPYYSDHVPHYSDHTVVRVWSGVELVIGKGEKRGGGPERPMCRQPLNW